MANLYQGRNYKIPFYVMFVFNILMNITKIIGKTTAFPFNIPIGNKPNFIAYIKVDIESSFEVNKEDQITNIFFQ